MNGIVTRTGRPTKFKPEMIEQVLKLCRLGATDKEIADFFQVSEPTLNSWKQKYPDFLKSLKGGKEKADSEVAQKLYHRATGYEHPDVHVSIYQGEITKTPLTKRYPPDTTAAIFWLKNRRPDLWRDTRKHEHEVVVQHELSDKERMRRMAFFLMEDPESRNIIEHDVGDTGLKAV